MKLYLSEKQIANLVSVLHEDDAATTDSSGGATSSPGTSATQSGGTGYPAVSKWESGLQRGPANQVGVTKWADVVGSKINRGKANQLKEQEEPLLNDYADEIRRQKEEKTKNSMYTTDYYKESKKRLSEQRKKAYRLMKENRKNDNR